VNFSEVSYEEAMRRARECVPVLKERAQKCEDARVLLPENEKLLHETGLFRFHQPKRFGGMELPFIAVVDLVAELARGCPSTAWNVGNLGCHHWILAYYEPATQHEVWDANPDALIASSIALAAGRGKKVDGGFVVSGKWPFSSGVDNSQWNMLAVTIYEDKTAVDWRLCLVPKKDYAIIDTWYAMGMVGTGSKDIEVKEVFVPERRALPLARCRGGLEHPGATLNDGPLFRVPIVASAGHPLSATALGAAEGAFDSVVNSFKTRIGTYTGAKVSDFQAVQIKIAEARCLIDSATHLMRESALGFEDFANRNSVPDIELKLRWRAQNAYAVRQARRAVETLWSCYGANAIYTRDPLQRYLRDLQAINQHFSFNFDIAGAAYGTLTLGGKYANPTM
jgi:3-hydroxy-9,10-secoandrosta-1,3,5(10)-triene-9,17-dione monooxygenase